MVSAAHNEIQRLQRLHQQAELDLAVLQQRVSLSSEEEREIVALKTLKLRLEDRMIWVESLLSEHEAVANDEGGRELSHRA